MIRIFIFAAFLLATNICFSQGLLSKFQPRSKSEMLLINKIKRLPEVRNWLENTKAAKGDVMVGTPDAASKYYSFQIGLGNMGMFKTNYYLYAEPKKQKIYFLDQLDTSGSKMISLKDWRHWRKNPNFHKPHFYKAGKLISAE